jgi:hypothetical protein
VLHVRLQKKLIDTKFYLNLYKELLSHSHAYCRRLISLPYQYWMTRVSLHVAQYSRHFYLFDGSHVKSSDH